MKKLATQIKKLKKQNLVNPALILLLVGAAFYIGKIQTENEMLKGGNFYPTDSVLPTEEDRSALAVNVLRPGDDDHIRGNRDANIAIIEYSDYECPFCGQFHPTMQQIVAELGDSVMWVYRHWPLDFHPMALPAAIASECVADLAGEDAFWSFTDQVFANQETLSETSLDEWVLATGIGGAQYEACKSSAEIGARVNDDLNSGTDAGVQGTPGVIVLNIETGEVRVLPGAVPIDQVQAAIDSLK